MPSPSTPAPTPVSPGSAAPRTALASPVPPLGPKRLAAAPVAEALRADAKLAGLLTRLAESQARWAVAAALLPPELAAAARPGPLDEARWVIFAEHAAAATKLKLHVSAIESALAAGSFAALPVKVKVRPRIA